MEQVPAKRPGTREKLKALVSEYGPTAFVVYFAIFFLTWGAFVAAIHFGFRPESASGEATTWLAAYVATKATQILRIAATFAITPVVARLVSRMRKRPTTP
jgi:hypothetical protein